MKTGRSKHRFKLSFLKIFGSSSTINDRSDTYPGRDLDLSLTLSYERSIDAAQRYQDEVCGGPTTAAVQTAAELPERHQSQSLEIFAAASHQIPIQRRTAAAPAVSVISAMSHPTECSWVNFPLGSAQSCAFMKSPAQSIQRSSMDSKAYHDLLSMPLDWWE